MKLEYQGYRITGFEVIKDKKRKEHRYTHVVFRKSNLQLGEIDRSFSSYFLDAKIVDEVLHFTKPIKPNGETLRTLSEATKDFDLIDRYLDLFVDEVETEELQEMING